ncbi:TLC domain-containing protein 3A-like [Lytechinus pictus]|uniref:TLC domain-containing protein 3A-like n=1 Tax=Lytechinus pictus TaxID=7653 RepID=UPI0030B9BA94
MEQNTLATNFIIGCIFWPASFHLIWFLLSFVLSDTKACGSAMRLVSIIHAILAAAVGTISVRATHKDIIQDDHWLLNYFAAFAYPYMPYDTYAMYHAYIRERNKQDQPFFTRLASFIKASKLEVFHHAISTFLGYPIILRYRHNKGTFIVGCVYMTEYSTPFVNLRKILIKNGYGSSLMFSINNLLVLIMFFLVRVALWPAMYVIYAINKQQTFSQVLVSVPYGCHIAMAIVMALQTSWYVIFCRGFFKALGKSPKQDSVSTKQD